MAALAQWYECYVKLGSQLPPRWRGDSWAWVYGPQRGNAAAIEDTKYSKKIPASIGSEIWHET